MTNPADLLDALVGSWRGMTQLYLEVGVVTDEYETRGTFRRLPHGAFVAHDYEETFRGKAHQGLATYAFDAELGEFQCAWVHSFHMSASILWSVGKPIAGGFAVLGSYGDGAGGPRWGWRTEHVLDGDRLIVTAYNITPTGEEAKGVETVYRRAT